MKKEIENRIQELQEKLSDNFDETKNFALSGHEITGYGRLLNNEIDFLYNLKDKQY